MSREPKTAHILPWPRTPLRHEQERQFLPAALEIVETPPSPVGRLTALIIILFFCLALAWSWFGHVDIIATAQGQLVPTGKIKVLQPLESGIVRDIHTQDGDKVRTGDLLITLDDTEVLADRDKAMHLLKQAKLDVARLTALRNQTNPEQAVDAFVPPESVSPDELQLARSFIWAQAAEQQAKTESLEQQIGQKIAEAEEIRANIEKLNATMPILEERDAIRTRLLAEQVGDKFQWLDAEQALMEAKHNLIVQDRQLVEIDAARQSLQRQKDQAIAEYDHQLLSDLSDSEQDVSGYTQDLVKAERRLVETKLRAPIDGVVQQLAIHTLGGVVTPAQQLLQIVPDDQSLILETKVANADVGFIRAGQEAQIKVETYNFTRYGLVHGHVISISPDVVTEDKRAIGVSGDQNSDGKTSQSDTTNQSPAYIARIAPDTLTMKIDGRDETLKPGMAVTAEIKTGSRRILQYLLSPIREYQEDSIRER
ncbi:HlyD family type I secretion periplasmic adaptor subunit [Rhizobium sp.]|uniref:HlyD family type I secretion periplasmic adaptor subunit n=1 Tax=Rhizobium sp. TaxID=391 RepID=UPI002AA8BAD3